MKIGVLALQGAFAEHRNMLSALGVESFEIRQRKDADTRFDGLIIPGGESTVQGKLLVELALFEPLRDKILAGLPVFGTCAGLLLLSKTIENDARTYLATMNIKAVRNCDTFLWTLFYITFDLSPFVCVCSTVKSVSQRQKFVAKNLMIVNKIN